MGKPKIAGAMILALVLFASSFAAACAPDPFHAASTSSSHHEGAPSDRCGCCADASERPTVVVGCAACTAALLPQQDVLSEATLWRVREPTKPLSPFNLPSRLWHPPMG